MSAILSDPEASFASLKTLPNKILGKVLVNINNVYDVLSLITLFKDDKSKLLTIKNNVKHIVFATRNNQHISYDEYDRLHHAMGEFFDVNYEFDLYLNYDIDASVTENYYHKYADFLKDAIPTGYKSLSRDEKKIYGEVFSIYFSILRKIIMLPNLINYDIKISELSSKYYPNNDFINLCKKLQSPWLSPKQRREREEVKFQILQHVFYYKDRTFEQNLQTVDDEDYYQYLIGVPIDTLIGDYAELNRLPVKNLVHTRYYIDVQGLTGVLDDNIDENRPNGTIESISVETQLDKKNKDYVFPVELIYLYKVYNNITNVEINVDDLDKEEIFNSEGELPDHESKIIYLDYDTEDEIEVRLENKIYPTVKVYSVPIPLEYWIHFRDSFPNVKEWTIFTNKSRSDVEYHFINRFNTKSIINILDMNDNSKYINYTLYPEEEVEEQELNINDFIIEATNKHKNMLARYLRVKPDFKFSYEEQIVITNISSQKKITFTLIFEVVSKNRKVEYIFKDIKTNFKCKDKIYTDIVLKLIDTTYWNDIFSHFAEVFISPLLASIKCY